MRRRRLLAGLGGLAAGGLAGLAGCSAADPGGGDGRTVNPALRGTPTGTPSPTPEPTPYGAAASDRLAEPRDLVLANHRLAHTTVYLGVREGERLLLETTPEVPGGDETRLAEVFGAARTYDIAVRTADGRSAVFEWTATADGGDLGVDLGATVRHLDRYGPTRARELVTGATGGVLGDGGRATVPVRLDNPGPARPVELAFATGDGSRAGVSVDVPADARAAIPISVPSETVTAAVTVGEASDRFRWQPLADGPLVARVSESPRFLCDLLARDLRVVNADDNVRVVDVEVHTDGEQRFGDRFAVIAGGMALRRAVVPPGATVSVRVESDGETERVDWERCLSVGPITVYVREDSIDVTVSPTDPDG